MLPVYVFLPVVSGAPPPAWAPGDASVPVRAWYKADAGVTGSSPVTAIADQSGAGDANRNQTASNGTLNVADAAYGGKDTISNLRTTRVGAWSAVPSTPITVLVVGEISGAVTGIVSEGSMTDMVWYNGTDLKWYGAGAGALTVAANPAVPCVMMYEDTGAASALYLNALSAALVTGGGVFDAAITGFDIGQGVAGVGGLVGKVAEIIIWGGVLDATDKANLVTYLNTTRAYGLGVT